MFEVIITAESDNKFQVAAATYGLDTMADFKDVSVNKSCAEFQEISLNKFLDGIYECAFGADGLTKGYTRTEVLDKLKEFAENSWKYDELSE